VSWRAVVGYRDAHDYVLQLADDTHFLYDGKPNPFASLHDAVYASTRAPGAAAWLGLPRCTNATHEIVYTAPDAYDAGPMHDARGGSCAC